MAEFTAGPWERYALVNVLGGDGRRSVANAGGHSDNRQDDCGLGENIANARLIAAAPSLLLALETLLQWFRPSEDTDDADDPAVAAARQAHVAVKLARGEGT